MGAVFLVQRPLHDDVDHAAVFGVQADQRAVLRGAAERLENGRVVHHQHARIRHEQLEAGHAFAHHVVHVFQAGFAQVGDDHVQAVVDAWRGLRPSSTTYRARRACACPSAGWRNRSAWWCRRMPRRACRFQNRRSKWCRRRACPDACGRRSRRAESACRVASITCGLHVDRRRNGCDSLAFDQDIGRSRVTRGDHGSVLN